MSGTTAAPGTTGASTPAGDGPLTPPTVAQPPTPADKTSDDGDKTTVTAGQALRNLGDVKVEIPTSAFKELKARAQAKGRETAMAELTAMAKAAGFDSLEAALEAVKGKAGALPAADAQGKPPGTPPTGAAPTTTEPEWKQAIEKVAAEIGGLKKVISEAESQAQARAATAEAMAAFKAAGLRDADYGLHLLTRTLEALPDDQAKAFDYATWLTSLRKDKPYLFEPATGATTGARTAGGAPPPPGAAPGAAAEDQRVDAMRLTPQELTAYMAKRGIRNPALG